MTLSLLAALVAVNVAYLLLLDRKDKRDRDERQVLLQRIQAPEAAVYEHATRNSDEPEDGMPMTDQMVADDEARQALERLQQMEQQAEFDGRRL